MPLATSPEYLKLGKDYPVAAATLLQFVKKHGGQTKRIFYKANRIYLITAMLFRAIESAKATNTLLEEHLPRIQSRMPAYEYKLYREGLERLREINPELTFTTPHNYIATATIPFTDEEESFLSDAIKSEMVGF